MEWSHKTHFWYEILLQIDLQNFDLQRQKHDFFA